MTDSVSPDDDWNDLARELGVDKPAPPPPEAPPADMVERLIEAEVVEPHHGVDARTEEEALAEGEPEAAVDEEFNDQEEAAEEPSGEELPSTGRKHRRRRRRRRKGGTPAEAGEALLESGEEEEEGEAALEPAVETDEYPSEDVETEIVPVSSKKTRPARSFAT